MTFRLTSPASLYAALSCVLFASTALPLAASSAPDVPHRRTLTIEERISAQRAIERVYYSYRLGTKLPFDQAVPAGLLEKKVRNYLKQTIALEEYWHTPVTTEALRRELQRIMAGSQYPERLAEIRAALNGDEYLMMETLARAVLVDRLVRSFLANDEMVRGSARSQAGKPTWDEWWAGGSDRFDESRVVETPAGGEEDQLHGIGESTPAVFSFPPQQVVSCATQDFWAAGHVDTLPEPRTGHTAVWTGSEMIIWGGTNSINIRLNIGSRYDPATDTWSSISTIGAPSARRSHTAVWTGTEMIVWGGDSGSQTNTGGRYDPVSDTWQTTSTVNAPIARIHHTAVWAGSRMIIWGGMIGSTNTGGLYDPATDTWSATSIVGAPSARIEHTAIWTGTEMIIWGGNHSNTGGRYDPATNTWLTTSLVGVPSGRSGHTAVWTGSVMIIWGSFGSGFAPTGGRYDPATDQWAPTTQTGAPTNRYQHTSIWTGSEMIVWGGTDFSHSPPNEYLNTGARYNPVSDSWVATTGTSAPSARGGHTAVWTGSLMVVWGTAGTTTGGRYAPASNSWTPTRNTRESLAPPQSGRSSAWTGAELILWGGGTSTGAKYDAITDSWMPMTTVNAPAARKYAPAVWTGTEMIVWSTGESPITNTGGRYNPASDTWTSTSLVNAPSARYGPTAIWSGSEMIVYGGTTDRTGGRYDPATNTWSATSTVNAPYWSYHSAVWTGTEMIVWGGGDGSSLTNTGARYDPVSDTWEPTSTTGAPTSRQVHTAVWTGSRMIIWGGHPRTNTGGLYDPPTNTWTPSSLVNAPQGRYLHTAVWTGTEMIVWGGTENSQVFYEFSLNTGGRYDPSLDTWTPTTMTNTPARRSEHVAVWAGRAMIVWGGSQYNGDTVAAIDDRNMPWYGNTSPVAADVDGDGVGECTDCDDADDAAWGAPGEVADLEFQGDGQTLTWQAPGIAGGSGMTYDTIRSTASADFVNAPAVCLETLDGDTVATDTALPPAGSFFYYLVRARNSCPWPVGVGSAGAGSSGVDRPARDCP